LLTRSAANLHHFTGLSIGRERSLRSLGMFRLRRFKSTDEVVADAGEGDVILADGAGIELRPCEPAWLRSCCCWITALMSLRRKRRENSAQGLCQPDN